jgi:hypothetical protein
MMTLAPELPGADELIDMLLERGVAVSCGHTDATAEEARDAFDRGARAVTHLFNAMRPFRTATRASPARRSRARTSSCRSSSTACTSPRRPRAWSGSPPPAGSRS